MAKRKDWYVVTSPRSQVVTLGKNNAKQMARGKPFQSTEKVMKPLLRRRVARKLHPREVPQTAPVLTESTEDITVVLD